MVNERNVYVNKKQFMKIVGNTSVFGKEIPKPDVSYINNSSKIELWSGKQTMHTYYLVM